MRYYKNKECLTKYKNKYIYILQKVPEVLFEAKMCETPTTDTKEIQDSEKKPETKPVIFLYVHIQKFT
jgi:hypothetical protein